jgi:hypothetical protein
MERDLPLILWLAKHQHRMIYFKRSASQLLILAFRATTVPSLHMDKQDQARLTPFRARPERLQAMPRKMKEVFCFGNSITYSAKSGRLTPTIASKKAENKAVSALKSHG